MFFFPLSFGFISRTIVAVTVKRETDRGIARKRREGFWWMRRRKADDVRERRMECLMGPFRGESFAGYVTFTRNVELLAYHAWSYTELVLYRGAWQQVPLYIQFIVITRATSNMPKYIGFTKPAAHAWKPKNALVINYLLSWTGLRCILQNIFWGIFCLWFDNYINEKNSHIDIKISNIKYFLINAKCYNL